MILELYRHNTASKIKSDGTIVTEADMRAHTLIHRRLTSLFPDIPIISEEDFDSAQYAQRTDDNDVGYFLIDPLDGTKEFVKRTNQFAICIGYLWRARPYFGYIWSPCEDKGYFGGANFGTYLAQSLHLTTELKRAKPRTDCRIIISGSESPSTAKNFIHNFNPGYNIQSVDQYSSALKFGLMCEGYADIYPRMLGSSEWDIAAGHALLMGLGGDIITLDGQPLLYGKDNARNPPFIAGFF